MPGIDIVIDYEPSGSVRCQQLEAMFDVPPQQRCRLSWSGDLPIDNEPWNIGLIVGPSGSGKSTIARQMFGDAYEPKLSWGAPSVIDDFSHGIPVAEIARACSAVGFNTVPAWFRPYHALSTGERFRVEVARRMLELPDPIIIDEFTSVVDRQVAKIGAFAVQKYVRNGNRRLVAISCHSDVIDWLNPDWIFEPATMEYRPRGCLQQIKRPGIEAEIRRVPYEAWRVFAPFHYLTAELNRSAECFCMFVGGEPVAFVGIIHLPNRRAVDLKRISRIVTLPDWQGVGAGPILAYHLAAAYKALGFRLRSYPAHPSLIRVADKSPLWALKKKPGYQQKLMPGVVAGVEKNKASRPCAVFEYVGPAMNRDDAEMLIRGS